MKVDNDSIEKIKIIFLFILQSYKIIMGTLITLFIPQKCFYLVDNSNNIYNNTITNTNFTNMDRLCSFQDNFDNLLGSKWNC